MSEEKNRRNKSLVITGLIQLIVLLALHLLAAWKAPRPPIKEFGIELAFEKEGAGVPPEKPQQSVADQEPEAIKAKEEPIVEQEEIIQGEPADQSQEIEAEQGNEPILDDSAEEGAIQFEEQTVPAQEMPLSNPDEEAQEEEAAAPIIDSRSLFTNADNHPNEGASLQLAGWVWDSEPTPYDDSSETGKVVFKITIDSEGYILRIMTQSSTLTPSVEKYYRQAVERLNFSKTSAYKPAPASSGTITFIIRSD